MKKSVYSLVLMDDVIKAVDSEAYRLGTSRSNLINQILAAHLSCTTPEMRMQEIFSSLSDLIGTRFSIQQQRSASLMTLRTALDYKYRPTINYKVELERAPGDHLGTLRVHIRTQNSSLIAMFNGFFAYRAKLEAAALAARGYADYICSLTDGSFSRKLVNSGLGPEQTGEAISRYLTDLNSSIQTYFTSPQDFPAYAPQLAANYEHMLNEYIL